MLLFYETTASFTISNHEKYVEKIINFQIFLLW